MQDRLPLPDPSQWSDAQRAAVQAVTHGPRGALVGPFVPLLRSPELMDHVQRLGEYLRYRNALGHALGELAICMVARHWQQQVEWSIHAPIAEKAGIAASTLQAIAQGQRPADMPADQAVVHDFCAELLQTQRVSDATWLALTTRFGEPAAVDLTGICGYYSLLAMVMNVAQTPAPVSSWPPLPTLRQGV